jgi:UDP:flavonoid glycosyltransferase YjiC (YdhE family)
MDAALADCDLAICHGGHGTVGSALLAGVPLLVLPFNVEQYHTGERVQSLGAGRSATLDDPGGIEEALAALLAGERRGSRHAASRRVTGILTAPRR